MDTLQHSKRPPHQLSKNLDDAEYQDNVTKTSFHKHQTDEDKTLLEAEIYEQKVMNIRHHLKMENTKLSNDVAKKVLQEAGDNVAQAKIIMDKYIKSMKNTYPNKMRERIILQYLDNQLDGHNQHPFNQNGTSVNNGVPTVPGSILYLRRNGCQPKITWTEEDVD
jgi:hypothetical protein